MTHEAEDAPEEGLQWVVEESIGFANASFGSYLLAHRDDLSGEEFHKRAVEEVDYKGREYSQKRLMSRLNYATSQLTHALRNAGSGEDIYDTCRVFVMRELEKLFYETNDPIAARLKRDYLSSFINAFVADMDARDAISPEVTQELQDIIEGFNLGLKSYDALRHEVEEISNGETTSLRELVQMERKHSKKKLYDEHELTHAAHDRMRRIYARYAISLREDVPPPTLLLSLLSKSLEITKEQMISENPYTDWESVHDDHPEQALAKAMPILLMVSKHYSDDLTFPKLKQLDAHLNKMLWKARGLPEDFGACLKESTEAATQHMNDSLDEVFKQWELERHGLLTDENGAIIVDDAKKKPEEQKPIMARPKTYELQQRLFPLLDKHATSKQYFRWRTDELTQAIERATSKKEVIDAIEGVTESMINDLQFAMTPPAYALATRNYLDQFRQTLAEELRQRGSYDETFMARLNEEVEKFDLVYESVLTARSWLFEASKGEYDHYKFKAFVDTLPEHPRLGNSITAEHDTKLKQKTQETFAEVMQQRGIPKEVALEPFAPILFERCLEAAEKRILEQSDRMLQGQLMAGQKPAFIRKALRDWSTIDRSSPEFIDLRRDMAVELFRGAIALLPVDGDVAFKTNVGKRSDFKAMLEGTFGKDAMQDYDKPVEDPCEIPRTYSAEGLRIALDYIEHVSQRGRSH